MTLMRLELTIYSTSIKSYFEANNIIELNQNILGFFEKLADKLFLRLVDPKTGKVKKTNQRSKPLDDFTTLLKNTLSTASAEKLETQ